MIKQNYPFINESISMDTTVHGLTMVFIQKTGFKTSSFYLAVPYGSLDYAQDVENQTIINPLGIAHFLEHQLFENNQGLDIMEAFSQLGANVNAFTSHTETVYTFNSSKRSVTKALNLLLDFVQQLTITPQSVEKEKGIIIQELNMYMQMPEQRLVYETYQSLYHAHPIRFDIGGTEQSVRDTRYEDLVSVYERNYHPSRSILVCVSSLPASTLQSIVIKNQEAKRVKPMASIKQSAHYEPNEVVRERHRFEMDIQNSKCTYSYKLRPTSSDAFENLRTEWAIRCLCELKFSPLNPEYEQWIKDQRIHDYFGYEVECNNDYGFVLFFGETEDFDGFKQLIEDELKKDIQPLVPYLDALKRRYFSSMIRSLDDHDDYAITWIRSFFQGLPFENQFSVLDTIDEIFIRSVQANILDCSTSLVVMSPKR